MALQELDTKRNHALVETHLTIDYMMLRYNYRIHKVGKPLVYIFNSVVLPKGSLYSPRVEYLVQLFVEHGLTIKWLKDTMGPKKTAPPEVVSLDASQVMPEDPMTTDQLQVTFFLFLIGLLLGIISFIFELLIPFMRSRLRSYSVFNSLHSMKSKTFDFIH